MVHRVVKKAERRVQQTNIVCCRLLLPVAQCCQQQTDEIACLCDSAKMDMTW